MPMPSRVGSSRPRCTIDVEKEMNNEVVIAVVVVSVRPSPPTWREMTHPFVRTRIVVAPDHLPETRLLAVTVQPRIRLAVDVASIIPVQFPIDVHLTRSVTDGLCVGMSTARTTGSVRPSTPTLTVIFVCVRILTRPTRLDRGRSGGFGSRRLFPPTPAGPTRRPRAGTGRRRTTLTWFEFLCCSRCRSCCSGSLLTCPTCTSRFLFTPPRTRLERLCTSCRTGQDAPSPHAPRDAGRVSLLTRTTTATTHRRRLQMSRVVGVSSESSVRVSTASSVGFTVERVLRARVAIYIKREQRVEDRNSVDMSVVDPGGGPVHRPIEMTTRLTRPNVSSQWSCPTRCLPRTHLPVQADP